MWSNLSVSESKPRGAASHFQPKVIYLISNPHLEHPLLPWQHWEARGPVSEQQSITHAESKLCDPLMCTCVCEPEWRWGWHCERIQGANNSLSSHPAPVWLNELVWWFEWKLLTPWVLMSECGAVLCGPGRSHHQEATHPKDEHEGTQWTRPCGKIAAGG